MSSILAVHRVSKGNIMDKELLVTLINNGVVREGTKITVLRTGIDLGGSPTPRVIEILEIAGHKKVKDEIMLATFRTSDGKKFKVKAAHIRLIDGMPPSRLVAAHKSEGKKRGRKPKKR